VTLTSDVTEDEDRAEPEDDDDEPINPLVDALFDEVEELRMRVCPVVISSVISFYMVLRPTREAVRVRDETRDCRS
jgi:hypothetical protein